MTSNEYQALCLRTAKSSSESRQLTQEEQRILNWCLGLSGEVGELLDHIKKVIFHGHRIDSQYIKKELGDIDWYVNVLAYEFSYTMEQIQTANIEKLKKRYPDGFSSKHSQDRKDK